MIMARHLDKTTQSHLLRAFCIAVASIYTTIHTASPWLNENAVAQDMAHLLLVWVLKESLTLSRSPGREMCFRGLVPANTQLLGACLHVS